MEAAGASNVSHAAETRGMDSADKEPELSCSGGATWGKQGGHAPPSPGNVYTDCELQNVKQRRGGSPPSPPPPPPTRQVRPLPVQDLLLRLEGKGEPIKKLPRLRGAEFRDLYRESASLMTNALGYPTLRSQVRVRMLEAIGNCNTLESLDVRDICGGRISSLKENRENSEFL
ncbi:hypothetical protein AXG93_1052s1370 [Marchantia polymorpha subsp. ruderalis]|uniref:Uncharacterized protein n=1 Tax=Marchantia polymorpha subsp. ruderalis TaxID=1480154 RepID=A0A176VU36_MARPO|nr:hypothetical protein AXG93_1052s1370 [Marchantia polymorpha subsp. ruderalis]